MSKDAKKVATRGEAYLKRKKGNERKEVNRLIAEGSIASCSAASELSTVSSTAEFKTDKSLTVPAESILSKQYAELHESHTKLSREMEINIVIIYIYFSLLCLYA